MARRVNGKAVRSIREAVGISQKTLAERAGVKQGTMAGVELGNHGMSPEKMRRVADALGVPLDAISSVTPEPEAAVS